MKRILVVNQFNSDNIGDKLLNDMICKNLQKIGFCVDNAGYAQQSFQTVQYNNSRSKGLNLLAYLKKIINPWLKYELMYRFRLNKTQSELDYTKYDAIIIGGGQLLKHNSVFIYCFRHWVTWAKKRNIPIFLHGIGVDSGLTKKEVKIYKRCLQFVDIINCRDSETKEIIKNLFSLDAQISPDIAFTFSFSEVNRERDTILVMPYNYLTANKSFQFGMSKLNYYRSIKSSIDRITSREPNLKIVLGATTSDDAYECYKFLEWYTDYREDCILRKITDSAALISECSHAKYMISGRMHAMIIGLITQAKIDPILVSNKIKTFKANYLEKDVDLKDISKCAFEGLKEIVKDI